MVNANGVVRFRILVIIECKGQCELKGGGGCCVVLWSVWLSCLLFNCSFSSYCALDCTFPLNSAVNGNDKSRLTLWWFLFFLVGWCFSLQRLSWQQSVVSFPMVVVVVVVVAVFDGVSPLLASIEFVMSLCRLFFFFGLDGDRAHNHPKKTMPTRSLDNVPTKTNWRFRRPMQIPFCFGKKEKVKSVFRNSTLYVTNIPDSTQIRLSPWHVRAIIRTSRQDIGTRRWCWRRIDFVVKCHVIVYENARAAPSLHVCLAVNMGV